MDDELSLLNCSQELTTSLINHAKVELSKEFGFDYKAPPPEILISYLQALSTNYQTIVLSKKIDHVIGRLDIMLDKIEKEKI